MRRSKKEKKEKMKSTGSGYARVNGNGNGGGNWLTGIACFFVTGIAVTALALSISALVRVHRHDHPTFFADASLSSPPVKLPFIANTTCMQVSGFQADHEKGVVVGDDYLMVSTSGTYKYRITAKIHFTEHFFVWTPWKLYVGVDNEKQLSEGSAHDIAWWASANESVFDWPVNPYAPADMKLMGLLDLQAGQKMNMFVGFPEFCRFCGLREQEVHAPGNVTVVDARMNIQFLSEISPGSKTKMMIFLVVLFLW
jgi:hypothetical protein